MAVLRLIQDGSGPKDDVFELSNVTVLGRAAPSTVILPSSSVSREHARIRSSGESYELEDLGSTNGTFLNGEHVRSAPIKHGDLIRIHSFVLEFLDETGKEAEGKGTDSSKPHLADATLLATRPAADLTGSSRGTDPVGDLRRRLRVLYDLSQSATGQFSVESLLDVMLDQLLDIFEQAEHVLILLEEPESERLSVAASRTSGSSDTEVVPSNTVIQHACERREAILSASALDDSRFQAAQSIVGTSVTSVMCAPVIADEKVLGAVYVVTREMGRPFHEDDLQLLVCVAATLAVFLQNAQLHEKSVQAERLATVGQTIAGMAHCVKNILSGLQGGSYIVDKNLPRDESGMVARGWEMVKRNMQFLSNIVLDMLSYSKERQPLYDSCDIGDTCRGVVELLTDQASRKDVELVAVGCDELGEVVVDEVSIRRCLINLAGNAIDACESGSGKVQVETARGGDPDRFAIHIRDNGCGMDAATCQKIFDPFFSTKGGKGTGLGMPVVKKIIEEHHGEITLDSNPGSGTTFTITLPVRPAGTN